MVSTGTQRSLAKLRKIQGINLNRFRGLRLLLRLGLRLGLLLRIINSIVFAGMANQIRILPWFSVRGDVKNGSIFSA